MNLPVVEQICSYRQNTLIKFCEQLSLTLTNILLDSLSVLLWLFDIFSEKCPLNLATLGLFAPAANILSGNPHRTPNHTPS